MKEINLRFWMPDEDYADVESMAERLNCSIQEVLVRCLAEGLSEAEWYEDEVCEKLTIEYARSKLKDLIP